MRTCGECTLCCKLPRVPELEKPSNEWCRHCEVGAGCRIHDERPQVCRDFSCLWLGNLEMTEEMRPDRAHVYFSMKAGDQVVQAMVDPAHPEAWREGAGAGAVCWVRGHAHVVVKMANQLTFLPASGLPPPEKLVIDWLL